MEKTIEWNQDWESDEDGDFKDFVESLSTPDMADYFFFVLLESINNIKEKQIDLEDKEILRALVNVMRELKLQEYKHLEDRNVFAGMSVILWNDIERIVAKRFKIPIEDLKLTNPIARLTKAETQ